MKKTLHGDVYVYLHSSSGHTYVSDLDLPSRTLTNVMTLTCQQGH